MDQPYLPHFDVELPYTPTQASAHYKGTRLCRQYGKDVEVRMTTPTLSATFVYLLTTAQAEQLRLDLECALERNAHATFR